MTETKTVTVETEIETIIPVPQRAKKVSMAEKHELAAVHKAKLLEGYLVQSKKKVDFVKSLKFTKKKRKRPKLIPKITPGQGHHNPAVEKLELKYYHLIDFQKLYDGILEIVGMSAIGKSIEYDDDEFLVNPEDLKAIDDFIVKELMISKESIEAITVRAYLVGKIIAHSEQMRKKVKVLLGGLPKTVLDAAKKYNLSEGEINAIKWGMTNAAENITFIGNQARNKVTKILIEGKQRRAQASEIARTLRAEIVDTDSNLNRNWQTVAITETAEMSNNGFIASQPPLSYVVGWSHHNACSFCRTHIHGQVMKVVASEEAPGDYANLEPDSTEYKHIQNRWETEIWVGKSNKGRYRLGDHDPHEKWVSAVIVHPKCRCRWRRFNPKYNYIENGQVRRVNSDTVKVHEKWIRANKHIDLENTPMIKSQMDLFSQPEIKPTGAPKPAIQAMREGQTTIVNTKKGQHTWVAKRGNTGKLRWHLQETGKSPIPKEKEAEAPPAPERDTPELFIEGDITNRGIVQKVGGSIAAVKTPDGDTKNFYQDTLTKIGSSDDESKAVEEPQVALFDEDEEDEFNVDEMTDLREEAAAVVPESEGEEEPTTDEQDTLVLYYIANAMNKDSDNYKDAKALLQVGVEIINEYGGAQETLDDLEEFPGIQIDARGNEIAEETVRIIAEAAKRGDVNLEEASVKRVSGSRANPKYTFEKAIRYVIKSFGYAQRKTRLVAGGKKYYARVHTPEKRIGLHKQNWTYFYSKEAYMNYLFGKTKKSKTLSVNLKKKEVGHKGEGFSQQKLGIRAKPTNGKASVKNGSPTGGAVGVAKVIPEGTKPSTITLYYSPEDVKGGNLPKGVKLHTTPEDNLKEVTVERGSVKRSSQDTYTLRAAISVGEEVIEKALGVLGRMRSIVGKFPGMSSNPAGTRDQPVNQPGGKLAGKGLVLKPSKSPGKRRWMRATEEPDPPPRMKKPEEQKKMRAGVKTEAPQFKVGETVGARNVIGKLGDIVTVGNKILAYRGPAGEVRTIKISDVKKQPKSEAPAEAPAEAPVETPTGELPEKESPHRYEIAGDLTEQARTEIKRRLKQSDEDLWFGKNDEIYRILKVGQRVSYAHKGYLNTSAVVEAVIGDSVVVQNLDGIREVVAKADLMTLIRPSQHDPASVTRHISGLKTQIKTLKDRVKQLEKKGGEAKIEDLSEYQLIQLGERIKLANERAERLKGTAQEYFEKLQRATEKITTEGKLETEKEKTAKIESRSWFDVQSGKLKEKWQSGREDMNEMDVDEDLHDAIFGDAVELKSAEDHEVANIILTLVNKEGSGLATYGSFGEGAFAVRDTRYEEILSALGGTKSKVVGIFKARSGPNYSKYREQKLGKGLPAEFTPGIIKQMNFYDKVYYFLGPEDFNNIFGSSELFEAGEITGRNELMERERVADDLGFSSPEKMHKAEHEHYGQHIDDYLAKQKKLNRHVPDDIGGIAEKDVKRFTEGYIKHLAGKGIETFERSLGLGEDTMVGEAGYAERLAEFKDIMYKRADVARENYALHPDDRLQLEMEITERVQYINDGGELTLAEEDMVNERFESRHDDARSSRIKHAVINYVNEARARSRWNKDRTTRLESNKQRIGEMEAELGAYSDIDLKQMKEDALEHGWQSPKQKLLEEKKLSKYAVVKAWVNRLWNF